MKEKWRENKGQQKIRRKGREKKIDKRRRRRKKANSKERHGENGHGTA